MNCAADNQTYTESGGCNLCWSME